MFLQIIFREPPYQIYFFQFPLRPVRGVFSFVGQVFCFFKWGVKNKKGGVPKYRRKSRDSKWLQKKQKPKKTGF